MSKSSRFSRTEIQLVLLKTPWSGLLPSSPRVMLIWASLLASTRHLTHRSLRLLWASQAARRSSHRPARVRREINEAPWARAETKTSVTPTKVVSLRVLHNQRTPKVAYRLWTSSNSIRACLSVTSRIHPQYSLATTSRPLWCMPISRWRTTTYLTCAPAHWITIGT